MLQQDERYLRDYADKNALLALDDIGIDLSNIEEGTLKTGQLDGETYGIATGVNAMALLVNPALVEAAGMALPDDKAWSWADFSQFITDLSTKGDATGNSADLLQQRVAVQRVRAPEGREPLHARTGSSASPSPP